jgi:hypothetical protein
MGSGAMNFETKWFTMQPVKVTKASEMLRRAFCKPGLKITNMLT